MALLQEWDQKLFGISLELPSMSLNASSFSPPARLQQPGEAKQASGGPTSFLWQAPNSNAVLFLGERWVELHGFVAKLLEARNKLPQPPKLLGQKLVSKAFPSWLEHALRLCRARGYWTLYPSQPTSSFVASVHREHILAARGVRKRSAQKQGRRRRRGLIGLGIFPLDSAEPGRPAEFQGNPATGLGRGSNRPGGLEQGSDRICHGIQAPGGRVRRVVSGRGRGGSFGEGPVLRGRRAAGNIEALGRAGSRRNTRRMCAFASRPIYRMELGGYLFSFLLPRGHLIWAL